MEKENKSVPTSVQKLIEFLNKLTNLENKTRLYLSARNNASMTEDAMDFIACLDTLKRIYSCPIEDWNKIREVYTEFSILSEVLENSNFSDKDISEIVFYLIKKNLASGLTECPNRILQEQDLFSFPFHGVSIQEVYQFITTDAFYQASHKEEKDLSEKEKLLLSEIERCNNINATSFNAVLSYHQLIEAHYFDKSDSFDFEDIALVLEALKNLKVSAIVLDSVNKTLRKERKFGQTSLIKEESTTYKESEKDKQEREKQEKELQNRARQKRDEALLADNKKRRDEKIIYKKMRDIYDMEKREFLIIPTNEVILNWVTYAKLIQLPLPTILQFLSSAYKQISTMDPVVQYGLLYKKLKYYEEALDISSELEEIEQYIEAILEASSTYISLAEDKKQQPLEESILKKQEEEVTFFEAELKNKIGQTLALVPKDYEYEMK